MAKSVWERVVQRAGAKSGLTAKQVKRGIIQDARNSNRNKKERGANHA